MRATNAKLIWAIARNTVAQAIRIRVAFVIMAIFLILIPTLPFIVEGDGTLVGLLHVVITYAHIVAGVLLGLLTLAISTTTLWSDIQEKQIYLLEARPIRRWHLLVGKLAGILCVNAALLLTMAIALTICIEIVRHSGRWSPRDKALARKHVLTARRAIDPDPLPFEEFEDQIDRDYRRLDEQGLIPEGKSEADAKAAIRGYLVQLLNTIPTGGARKWYFSGVPRSRAKDATFTIRFKYGSSSSGDSPVFTSWHVGPPKTGPFREYRASRKPDEFHEIEFRARYIGADNRLEVNFVNRDSRNPATLVFAGDEAIQVLVPVGGFVGNLGRGLFLIFIEVLFLAILGLVCSTFLGFPVSPIVALSLLLLISLAGTVKAEFDKGLSLSGGGKPTQSTKLGETVLRGVTTVVRAILPPLDRYAASPYVSAGKEVPLGLILEAVGLVGCLQGGILLALGVYIFERREIAGAAR